MKEVIFECDMSAPQGYLPRLRKVGKGNETKGGNVDELAENKS